MNLNPENFPEIIEGGLTGDSFKIGVVTARFNWEITGKLEAAAIASLLSNGVKRENIKLVRVPGAVEIPLAAKSLIQDIGVDGVVTLGAVIRGETEHFTYVCQSVERGCTDLILETGRPIGFGVLTTENDEQAEARAGGAHGNKGRDVAEAVLNMCNLLKELKKNR